VQADDLNYCLPSKNVKIKSYHSACLLFCMVVKLSLSPSKKKLDRAKLRRAC
jgi:hypothetical protein